MTFARRLVAAALGLGLAAAAQAAPTVGSIHADAAGHDWLYLGQFNVGGGPAWQTRPANYSGIEAAALLFGALDAGSAYAVSTSGTFVDHLAWYDGYGDGSHLPASNLYGLGHALAEDYFVDAGTAGYNTFGDYSAYVGNDRAAAGGGAINYVFRSFTAEPERVPEPDSLALVAAGLAGMLLLRRQAATA